MTAYRTDTAAQHLDMTVEEVRRLIRRGRLKATNVGTTKRPRYRIPVEAVREFLGLAAQQKRRRQDEARDLGVF